MNAIVDVSVRTFDVVIPISVYIARDWVRGGPYFDLTVRNYVPSPTESTSDHAALAGCCARPSRCRSETTADPAVRRKMKCAGLMTPLRRSLPRLFYPFDEESHCGHMRFPHLRLHMSCRHSEIPTLAIPRLSPRSCSWRYYCMNCGQESEGGFRCDGSIPHARKPTKLRGRARVNCPWLSIHTNSRHSQKSRAGFSPCPAICFGLL